MKEFSVDLKVTEDNPKKMYFGYKLVNLQKMNLEDDRELKLQGSSPISVNNEQTHHNT